MEKFPLSPVPLALVHADGERRKTNKSALHDHAFSSSQPKVSFSGIGKNSILPLPNPTGNPYYKVYRDAKIND